MKKIIFALLLIAPVLAACQDPYQGNPSAPKLDVVGDSITANSKATIYSVNSPDFYTGVAATIGERSDGYVVGDKGPVLIDDATQAANTAPSIVVVNLGTNDVASGFTTAQTLSNLANVRAKFNGCVISVTLTTHVTATFKPAAADPAAYNAATAAINAGLPTGHLIDWNAETTEHPEYLSPDGVHPSATGMVRYAQLIHDAAVACM